MRDASPVAIVTGAANGIGWAIAQGLSVEGYAVGLLDLDEKLISERARELGNQHGGFHCDVSDQSSVTAAFEAVHARYSRLDVLVNNAGILGSQEPSIEQDMMHFDRVTKVILNGTFLCCRAAYIPMAAQRLGSIVNIGSIAGLVGLPRRNAYGAAKAGVHSLTRALAAEWGGLGIRVNAIAPGYIATAMVKDLIERGVTDVQRLERRIPMGRLGSPEEVADVAVFLASRRARYITGALLSVDGGWAAFGDAGHASEPLSET